MGINLCKINGKIIRNLKKKKKKLNYSQYDEQNNNNILLMNQMKKRQFDFHFSKLFRAQCIITVITFIAMIIPM